jgi:ATP-grasp domain-containing protein
MRLSGAAGGTASEMSSSWIVYSPIGVFGRYLQADGHLKVLLDMIRDDSFGPAVTVGLGGMFAELFNDTALRVPPFGRGDVHRALDSLRSRDAFGGALGEALRASRTCQP